ncbi:MAG: hypothetical protein JSS69_15330 [Acidobacteria bacterium]|nr:hypothetical protein [Acidobacteriota bacterium]MBS1867285.1 hypothetical protein [Acidobacteriota bacterium]
MRRAASVVLLCSALAALSGCAERQVHARPWATVAQIRPNPPAVRTPANADSSGIAPDLSIAPPEINVKLLGSRPMPARPRVESPRPSGAATASKTQTLVPELSPQETTAAQQQFSESIAIAERNLATAKTKSLSALQSDTVSKVTAFLTEAREAGVEGDWGRARNLAKKAQILSEDLVRSF